MLMFRFMLTVRSCCFFFDPCPRLNCATITRIKDTIKTQGDTWVPCFYHHHHFECILAELVKAEQTYMLWTLPITCQTFHRNNLYNNSLYPPGSITLIPEINVERVGWRGTLFLLRCFANWMKCPTLLTFYSWRVLLFKRHSAAQPTQTTQKDEEFHV